MAYDEALADRIRLYLTDRSNITEKRMFGGLVFMWQGNMLCGVDKTNLMLRVGPDKFEEAVEHPQARVMDLTGRPMKGWILVSPAGVESDEDLRQWLDMATAFVSTLPPK